MVQQSLEFQTPVAKAISAGSFSTRRSLGTDYRSARRRSSHTVVMYPVAPPTGKVRGMAGEARVYPAPSASLTHLSSPKPQLCVTAKDRDVLTAQAAPSLCDASTSVPRSANPLSLGPPRGYIWRLELRFGRRCSAR